MASQPAPGEEPEAVDLDRDDEVPEADALDQAREVQPGEHFEWPNLDGEVSEYDALEQARSVELDEDEGYGPPDANDYPE